MRQSVSGSVDPVSGASNSGNRAGGQRPLNGATVFGSGNLQNNQASGPVIQPIAAPILQP